ncbi:nitrogenase iron-molybdenum cofactor biosynthesis protein NifN [Blastopirellula sp. JC732]|uniref:Nitrogenase iron-molybdenum cofactor biosynthesis protein NifN n=1 Tax=Blastopirellula sediminis TaxID=2894196 RepID=A0A9X1MMU9_9BACT|nr:nitrogenase iron-molybdenum cofactor biosynthesis protein NifN [Blastopirellula sediminis]MCC9608416.1 nitrogenase iron-molybdenum cofactor biosynthesis protein NifN [Blastopirellula sediminis]MCC9628807.1 nitrogenase iron-molybdenum cofactor biosynthesis protein NifN [Blastopirellula sediminis]
MAEIKKRKKPLSVSPLKASQTIGASIAFLGIDRSIPMMHGSQGCTAFGKVFFVRHFREPIPLQTTAMDQASSVLGADENVIIGLKTICEKTKPDLIGLPTTGLAETQGCDVQRNVAEFRERFPEFESVRIVPVNTPDFTGSFEHGYAAAVKAMIETLVPESSCAGEKPQQVNVLAGSALSVGDVEWLGELIESFGLEPIILPDLSMSLDGHLTDRDYSPVSAGGMPVDKFNELGKSAATLVIGDSLTKAADALQQKTGVPNHYFPHLMGLEMNDRFIMALMAVSGKPAPKRLERQRSQLQDAMLDAHFTLGQARIAMAGDPDLLIGFSDLLSQMGCEIIAAVAPANAPILTKIATEFVQIGDLEDLEKMASQKDAQLIIGNSHAVATAERLKLPLIRAGFPQYDLLGGYGRCWSGYQATRQALFDFSNAITLHREHLIQPYHSIYSQKRSPHAQERNHDDQETYQADQLRI